MVPNELNARAARIKSPVPFWFLNGKISEQHMIREIGLMAANGISQVIVHPRYGLDCEYLSDDWFRIFGWCVREARKNGMKLWIYDEFNFPSGTANFQVLKTDPNYQSKYLTCQVTLLPETPGDVIENADYVVAADIVEGKITKTRIIGSQGEINNISKDWHIFAFTKHFDPFYVDSLSKQAVTCFRDLTYEEYYKRFGEDFGETIEAVFTDEPSIYWVSVGHDDWNLPYTDDIFETYKTAYGESAISRLPYLFFDGRIAQEFRARFWRHAGNLFNERYHGTLGNWCREHNIIYTGHNNHEEPLRYQIRFQGDMFGTMALMDIPGVDHLLKQTLGNYWISIIGHKICSSQAHTSGKTRCMSESFGNVDWDSTFIQLKQIVDWQYGLGINLLVPHAIFHTISGQTKRESPPSFFYQSPHWQDFDYFGSYIRNLEKMLVGGKHICKVAVLYPLSGLCAEYQPDHKTNEFEHIESFLNSLCQELLKSHIDFDLLDRSALERAELIESKIMLADEEYEYLLIPVADYMADEDVALIMKVFESGVQTVMFFRSIEYHAHNSPGEGRRRITPVRSEELQQYIGLLGKSLNIDIELSGGGAEDILLYRRNKDGQRIFFMVNRSAKHRKVSAVLAGRSSFAIYDPENDSYSAPDCRVTGMKTSFHLRFEPYQSLFVVEGYNGDVVQTNNSSTAVYLMNLEAKIEHNVAVLFNFDYTNSDGIKQRVDVRENPRIFPANWTSGIMDYERFAGVYETTIEIECDPSGIHLVLDCDYTDCEIEVNGNLIKLSPCMSEDGSETYPHLTDWFDVWTTVPGLLKRGNNRFRIISPTKLCEPLRFVGDFGVQISDVLKLVESTSIAPFSPEATHPFHSGNVHYTASFEAVEGNYLIDLHDCLDTAEIWVNDRCAGKRLWNPYRIDISNFVVTGHNKLEIIVRNNLANLLMGTRKPFGLRRLPTLMFMSS